MAFMAIAEAFVAEFDSELRSTRRMLESVPDSALDYQPHAKSMNLARLAGHVAEMPSWGILTAQQRELDISPKDGPQYQPYITTGRDAMLKFFDKYHAEAKEVIGALSDEAMREPWTLLARGEPIFTMPRIQVLKSMVLNHMIHHRAQLSVYLRMNDVPIPGMYGPSADDRQAF